MKRQKFQSLCYLLQNNKLPYLLMPSLEPVKCAHASFQTKLGMCPVHGGLHKCVDLSAVIVHILEVDFQSKLATFAQEIEVKFYVDSSSCPPFRPSECGKLRTQSLMCTQSHGVE